MSTTEIPRPPATPPRPGPLSSHRTDLVAFVFGLGFLAIGLISLGNQLDWFGGDDTDFGGVVLAVIGGIGVLAVLAAGLRRSRTPHPEPVVITEPVAVTEPQAATSTPDDEIDS